MSEIRCAYCGKQIEEGDDVFVCLDNWLQWHHYCDLPEHKHYYCSKACFADDWSVELVDLDDIG